MTTWSSRSEVIPRFRLLVPPPLSPSPLPSSVPRAEVVSGLGQPSAPFQFQFQRCSRPLLGLRARRPLRYARPTVGSGQPAARRQPTPGPSLSHPPVDVHRGATPRTRGFSSSRSVGSTPCCFCASAIASREFSPFLEFRTAGAPENSVNFTRHPILLVSVSYFNGLSFCGLFRGVLFQGSSRMTSTFIVRFLLVSGIVVHLLVIGIVFFFYRNVRNSFRFLAEFRLCR